jgi:uncharacterized protein YjbI with pentapeptide repeats
MGMAKGKGTPTTPKQEMEARQSKPWTLKELGGKPVWEWMQLLIVPLALAVIGLLFEMQQAERQRALEEQQAALEDRRAEAERELAEQRAQDEALQAYLDQMSGLLLEKDLRTSEEDSEVRTLARARTATVIQRLDSDRNRNVIRFLKEAGLTSKEQSSIRLLAGADLRGALLEGTDLIRADLSEANLSGAELSKADLSETNLNSANLRGADLTNAYLQDAHLSFANLRGADLSGAYLFNADLSIPLRIHGFVVIGGTNLSGANLSSAFLGKANLREADLQDAHLSEANLRDAALYFAELPGADLRRANLRDATALTDEKIAAAKSLEGATMPDGQKYEEWLKDQESRGRGMQ